MMIFTTFFAFLLVSATTLNARVASPSLEETRTLRNIASKGQELPLAKNSRNGRRAHGAAGNQGQASSSAYSRDDFSIHIDVAADDRAETGNGQNNGGDASTNHKDPAQHKFSTASGFSAQPISASALNLAKAKYELKKKLQADNKKKLQLGDVSGEKVPKDPREELITNLMNASHDIRK